VSHADVGTVQEYLALYAQELGRLVGARRNAVWVHANMDPDVARFWDVIEANPAIAQRTEHIKLAIDFANGQQRLQQARRSRGGGDNRQGGGRFGGRQYRSGPPQRGGDPFVGFAQRQQRFPGNRRGGNNRQHGEGPAGQGAGGADQ
jgi:hypothetical protein